MLKFQINKNGVASDKQRIAFSSYTVDDIDFVEPDKILVKCYYDEDIDIKTGSTIIAFYDADTFTNGYITPKSKYVEYTVENVNADERYFTVIADRYSKLKGQYMTVETVRTYGDAFVTVQEYEALTDIEKNRYKPSTYEWDFAHYPERVSMSEYNQWENNSDINDYARSSYVTCYKKNGSDEYISAWEYYNLDDDIKSEYSVTNQMILSPYLETVLDADEYDGLMEYEKGCYVLSEYVYPMGETIEKDYLYVYFDGRHYFEKNGFVSVEIYFNVNNIPEFVDETEENLVRLGGGEVVNEQCLRFLADENTELLYNAVKKLNTSNYTFSPSLSDYEIVISNDENAGYILARLNSIDIYRENIVFPRDLDPTETNVSLYLVKHMTSISVPLTNMFSTDTFQETNVQEKFVDVETEKAINRIPEMEKDVYHPVFLETDGTFTKIHEIRFNLHFRRHRDETWVARPETFWNGVAISNGNPHLMNYNVSDNDGFFSYTNPDKQSDLLALLSFSNNDVKYQKNVLKKSFLRLSFYDSMRQSDQNMLSYSTIFMDTGKLFGKYSRNFQKEGYTSLPITSNAMEVNVVTRKNLNGIRTDREPTVVTTGGKNDDTSIEKYRLSSQFSVKDKYTSQSSSDGFYLYLWKDNETGFTPTDIYMKVEFNHAGFGRTIPFMMPFNENGIETFGEILSDWQNGEGYGIRKYIKFSYIHFKYRYNKETKQHIYYLNREKYPNAVLEEGGVLNINLWEAKVI